MNVHTTKPIDLSEGFSGLLSNAYVKATRHRQEADRLQSWLFAHQDIPVIVAGDFNAPLNTYNGRFEGLINAQDAAGHGVHRTFPRDRPFIGIDHVLASTQFRFDDYNPSGRRFQRSSRSDCKV